MPIRSILLSTPWHVICLLGAFCGVMIRLVRGITFEVGGSPTEPFVITAAELVSLLFALTTVVLLTPSMPHIDLRRRRAQWLSVFRQTVGAMMVVIVAYFASIQINVAYHLQPGTDSAVSPESELIINNSVLIFAAGGMMITQWGKSLGVTATIVLWATCNAPLVFFTNFTPWPFAVLLGEGPWFSLEHVAATGLVLIANFLVQFRVAGAGAFAIRADR